MKILHEEIEFCGDCPYCHFDNDCWRHYCEATNEDVDNERGITSESVTETYPPDWCPLPDKGD